MAGSGRGDEESMFAVEGRPFALEQRSIVALSVGFTAGSEQQSDPVRKSAQEAQTGTSVSLSLGRGSTFS